MKVEVYITPTCGYCHQAKRFLSERGVNFTEHDVSRDREAGEEMVRRTGQMGVPVIIIDGEVVVGFDRPGLESLLAKNGSGQHPRLGVKVADASKVAQKFGLAPVFGVLVGKVGSSSLGEKAGFRQGDIITEVNLRPIHNAEDLENALSALTVGSRVVIIFLRGQETLKSEIVA